MIKRLVWSEPQPASKDVRYDHVTAETPFGNFLITWKSWKEYNAPTIDETPWGDYFDCVNTVDDAKKLCEAEYERRLRECLAI